MIARSWQGAVRLADGASYAVHLLGEDARISDYTDVPGNLGAPGFYGEIPMIEPSL